MSTADGQRVNAAAESHRYLAEPSPKIRQEVASVASCEAMGVARKRVGDYDDLVLELRRVASRGHSGSIPRRRYVKIERDSRRDAELRLITPRAGPRAVRFVRRDEQENSPQ